MIQKKQVDTIKSQLIQNLNPNLSESQKIQVTQEIQAMNSNQLESFLTQSKIAQEQTQPTDAGQQCIFCSIIQGAIPSHKIDENKDAIAILEINPISKGHSIIIPKQHLQGQENLPAGAFSLAKKISKKLKSKLKPQEVKLFLANVMGHEIINILPIYKDETIASPRTQADKEKLANLQKKLKKKPTKKKSQKPKKKKDGKKSVKEKKIWLPRRIP